jgi:hypothetical protein
MALTDAELQRIRYELGYPNLDTAAEPYIGIAAFFSQVLQPYLLSGASTTSSTTVVEAGTPTATSIILADATDFAAGDVVVIGVDAQQERATLQSLSGSTATVQLSLGHIGTYPVVVEGAESIIRDILKELRLISSGMNGSASALSAFRSRVGLKKVDDVEFFGGGSTLASQGIDPLTQLNELREFWRDELARAIGIDRLNSTRASGGSNVSVY